MPSSDNSVNYDTFTFHFASHHYFHQPVILTSGRWCAVIFEEKVCKGLLERRKGLNFFSYFPFIFFFYFQIKYDFKWLSLAEPEGGEQLPQKSGEKVEEKFQGNSFERKHLPVLNVSRKTCV